MKKFSVLTIALVCAITFVFSTDPYVMFGSFAVCSLCAAVFVMLKTPATYE